MEKQIVVVGRWPVAVGLSLGALCAIAPMPQARAGTWSAPVYKVTSRYPAAPQDGTDYTLLPCGGGDTIAPGGAISSAGPAARGTVTATFTWNPNPGATLASDPPPKSIYIAETAGASWGFAMIETFSNPRGRAGSGSGASALRAPGAGSDNFALFRPGQKPPRMGAGRFLLAQFTGNSGGGGASNGLGSPHHPNPDGRGGSSSGTRLKKYDSSSGTVTTTGASPSAWASSSNPSDAPETSWSYNAQVTDFGISRVGAPAPKQESDPTLNKDHDEWIGDDGNGHGHTRWSYTRRFLAPYDQFGQTASTDELVTNTQIFTAPSGIGSSNSSTWTGTWSPSNPDRDSQPLQGRNAFHLQDMPDGGSEHQEYSTSLLGINSPSGWYYVPSSGTEPPQITYNLKNEISDVTASYEVKLHDEWENPTDNPNYSHTDVVTGEKHTGEELRGPFIYPLSVSPTPYIPPSSAPPGTPPAAYRAEWKFTWTAGQKVTLSFGFGGEFNLADWFNAKGEFESESSLEIKAEASSTAVVDLYPGDLAYPYIQYSVRRKHKLFDHFTNAGWDKNAAQVDGKHDQSADLPLRPQDTIPMWRVIPGGSSNPK